MQEQEPESLDGAQREMESALRRLKPIAAAQLDPIACAFEAGQLNGTHRARVWKSTTIALSLALAAATLLPLNPRESAPRVIAPTEHLATLFEPSRNTSTAYLSMRNDVLNRGVEALPGSTGAVSSISAMTPGGS